MNKILWLVLVAYSFDANGQVVNRVWLKNHRLYMTNVIQETVYALEERQWCNLKLPDVTRNINETVFGKEYLGNVTYKNGFLVSIQDVAVGPSMNQNFNPEADGTVMIRVTGQLNFIDAAVGYDVVTDLGNGTHHYTAVYTHPVLSFRFSVFRNAITHEMSVTVTGTQATSRNTVNMLPRDSISDVLTSLYDVNTSKEGVEAWAAEVFQPIALDVITERVEFPGYCYNCPIQI